MTIVKAEFILVDMKTANFKNAVTVTVAAKALEVTRQRMYQIIEEKGLKTQKFPFKPYPILLDRDQIMEMVEKKRAKNQRRKKK